MVTNSIYTARLHWLHGSLWMQKQLTWSSVIMMWARVVHKKQQQLKTNTRRAKTSAKTNLVWIRSPWSWWFPKCNGDFLVQSYICGKIFTKIRSVCREIRAKLWQNALSHNVEESFKKFLDPDLEVDDFQNLISSSLSIGTSVVKFSWRSVQ